MIGNHATARQLGRVLRVIRHSVYGRGAATLRVGWFEDGMERNVQKVCVQKSHDGATTVESNQLVSAPVWKISTETAQARLPNYKEKNSPRGLSQPQHSCEVKQKPGSHIRRLAVFGEFMSNKTYQFTPLVPPACAPQGAPQGK
jgi:hypothetical protein